MSRYAGMSPAKRRLLGYGLIAFFVLLIGLIGFSQWWAVNVNVPRLERAKATHAAP
jgi:hypothetical protein